MNKITVCTKKFIKITAPTLRCVSLKGSSECIKSYKEIPGPKGPFALGNTFNYLPLIGRYSWSELHKANKDKYDKYGSIVKETMLPGMDIIWLYDPQDIATVLSEKELPERKSHTALEKFRKDRPNVYNTGGLLPTNGPEWWRLRSELQKAISSPKAVRSFLPDIDRVTHEFLNCLPKNTTFDVLPKLLRLNLELICLVTFGERMNAFSEAEQGDSSLTSRLIKSAKDTNTLAQTTDQGLRLWRYFTTSSYKKLCAAQELMESVAVKLVSLKKSSTTRPCKHLSRCSLVEEYFENPKLDFRDIVGVAGDFLLAGTDTTSYTTAFALYHLARHPPVQNELYKECKKVLPKSGAPLEKEILNNDVPYARAVLKEVLRLNPISVGVGRILKRDMILGNYAVPKGAIIVTQNMVACRLETHFQDALTFNPERWLYQPRNAVNPYLVMPFGHGIRACIARRLAEQNILVLLLRMVQNYEVVWKGDNIELGVKTALINKPSQPVKIELIERKTNI